MIQLNYLGNTGERMIQYLCCRYMAERWGLRLRVQPIVGLPETYVQIKGEKYISPVMRLGGLRLHCIELGCLLPTEMIFRDLRAHVKVESFCFHREILEGALVHTKNWLRPEFLLRRPAKGVITLSYHFNEPRWRKGVEGHLRTQRAELNYMWPTAEEILSAVEGSGCTGLVVLTDRPGAQIWKDIAARIRCHVRDGGIIANYREAISARELLCAGTSMDWLCSVASSADRVQMLSAWTVPLHH